MNIIDMYIYMNIIDMYIYIYTSFYTSINYIISYDTAYYCMAYSFLNHIYTINHRGVTILVVGDIYIYVG